MSVITSSVPKAYRIARIFKNKGKIVGIGGPHPSVAPKEALEFCDFVNVGEMEGTWPKILNDIEKGKIKKIYQNKELVDLSTAPIPERDILRDMKKKGHDHNYISIANIYTTRGCPYGCAFCTVSNIYGRKYRTRPVKKVIEDILRTSGRGLGFAFFTDDNIWAIPEYAKELFREIIRQKIKLKWISQASLAQVEDSELLRLAKKAGCSALYIGYESVNPESLKETNKGFNKPDEFIRRTKLVQKAGILVLGSFVFGFDSDTEKSIKATIDFAINAKVDFAQFCVLTPFYNTALYDKLKKEGRIFLEGTGGGEFHDNWSYYTFGNVVFKPKNLTPQRLKELHLLAFQKFASAGPAFSRFLNGIENYPFLNMFVTGFQLYSTFFGVPQGGMNPKRIIDENLRAWNKEYGHLLKK
jgi:radical SAM superfamily enzyme YgiQ (UPF0313 family)